MLNKRISTLFFGYILAALLGCDRNKEKANNIQSDFSFYIPEVDLQVKTSKRANAKFIVWFSRTHGTETVSDRETYIECETMNSNLTIILNPKEQNNIFMTYPSVRQIKKSDLNIIRLTEFQLDSMFYEPSSMTNPKVLKEPYIKLSIQPATYTIIIQLDSSSERQKRIKEGDVQGGW